MIKIIPVLIFILSTTPVFAEVFNLTDDLMSKKIGANIEYLEDAERNLEFRDILNNKSLNWRESQKEALSFGFTRSVYWIRLIVENKTDSSIQWLLEQVYPLINYLDFYIPEKEGQYSKISTGSSFNYSQRPIDYRTFVFIIETGARSRTTYYLKYDSTSSMNIILNAYSPAGFQRMKDREAPFLWMFYGILIVMVIYNLFIFFSIRDISYFYYILVIAISIFLIMSLRGLAFQYIWPSSPWWGMQCIPFFIGIDVFTFVKFSKNFLEANKYYSKRLNMLAEVLAYINLTAGIASLLFSYRVSIISATIMLGFTLLSLSPFMLHMAYILKVRQAKFLGTSLSLLLLGSLLYVFKTWGILIENFVTVNGIYIGFVAMVVLLSLGLADRINMMKAEIQKAEKKYRNLVESSNDIIFSLDKDLKFRSVNQAVKRNLGFREEDVLNKNFLDFIQETWSEKHNIARRIVEEYISDLIRTKESVTFRSDFRTKYSHEPKELTVKLEYTESKGEPDIILGKASPIVDDIILQFLNTERHTYTADNYLNNAELLSHRLTRNLNKYINHSKIPDIRVALREILINAIEHGNLSLTFEEKTQAMMEGNYLQFIQKRQKDSRYSNRRVYIEYSLSEERVAYKITDEGEGFNYQSMLENGHVKANEDMLAHGRGIVMASAAFDEIKFNKKGNQILLVKYFSQRH